MRSDAAIGASYRPPIDWAGFAGLHSGLYRPLTTLMLAGEFWLWGEQPVAFHAVSILLHTANALLVYMR